MTNTNEQALTVAAGTLVTYNGDMANQAGSGHVVAVTPCEWNGSSIEISLRAEHSAGCTCTEWATDEYCAPARFITVTPSAFSKGNAARARVELS